MTEETKQQNQETNQTGEKEETKDKEQQNTGETSSKEEQKKKHRNVFEELGDTVEKFATRTVESIKETLDGSIISRNTVISIRVTDDANKKLNMLVDAGIFKSRSESASFLIEEGIKQQETLFEKIAAKLETIEKLKEELKNIAAEEITVDNTAG